MRRDDPAGYPMSPAARTAYRLTLPWSRPPLQANQRHHWSVRHRQTDQIRHTVAWLACAARVLATEHCVVTLVWRSTRHQPEGGGGLADDIMTRGFGTPRLGHLSAW